MSDKAIFSLRGRNLDVLTYIANLSNDEVFTPPDLANRMLDLLADSWAADHDGEDLWTNSHFLQFIRYLVRRQNEINTSCSLRAERHAAYFCRGILRKGSSPRSLDPSASLGAVTVVARKNNSDCARAHGCCK